MSRKIKLLPVNLEQMDKIGQEVYHQPPVEIIAPKSYGVSNDTSLSGNMFGVLGNALYTPNFFYSREFEFNWVGTKREIDMIRTILTQTSNQYFLFDGLEQNPIKTPSVMYNSKAMLASLVDQYKPPESKYVTKLEKYLYPNVFSRGTTGVQLSPSDTRVGGQFDIIPPYAVGAEAYFLLEKGKKYTWRLDFNYHSVDTERVHPTLFKSTIVELGTSNTPTVTSPAFYDLYSQITLSEPRDNDSIVKLQVIPPYAGTSTNANLRGWANYIAPIIFEGENLINPEKQIMDSFEEKPSILTPSGSGVYNVLSNSLAEFSCNFQEVVNAVSR